MRTLLRNLFFSARSLAKSPEFTLAAVLTLALGIGANTAVFSVVDAVALRPLPYPDAGRLVMVWDQLTKVGIEQFPPYFVNYYDYRKQNRVFEDIAAFSYTDLTLEGSGHAAPERLEAMTVSANFFPVLRVWPALGQAFTPEQNESGREGAVILSDGLWRRRFAADRGVAGRMLRLNGQMYRVQGVMPVGFEFTIRPGSVPDVWIPIVLPHSPASGDGFSRLVARLKPGISIRQAQADLVTIAAGIQAARRPYDGPHGEDGGYRVWLVALREQFFGSIRTSALILLGAVAFVLLIACANVANLLLARGVRRARELAIRTALGATRRQLLGELGTESLVLGLAGAGLGLLLAWWGSTALPSLASLPRQAKIAMDGRVLGFTVLISLATGLLFGLAPALRSARTGLNLSGGRRVVVGGSRLRSGLVAAEVGLSVALLAGAGLLLKSFVQLQGVDPGFDPRHVLTMRITLSSTRYREDAAQVTFFDRLSENLRRIPGVESAALVNQLPLAGGGWGGTPFSIEGRPYGSGSSGRVPQVARFYQIDSEYFRVLRIRHLAGRLIEQRDSRDAPKVAVINETMAHGFWPGGNALGQHVVLGAPRPGVPWLTIVGVVADVRNSDMRIDPIPQIYTPYAQGPGGYVFAALRTAGDPMAAAMAARRAISDADPEQAAYEVRPLQQRIAGSIQQDRFQTLLLGIFALAALALAAIGIYGVLEHSVSQRIPEIGLRMALGAGRADVLRMVVGQGMAPAILGLAVGLAAALALTRLLRSLLFGVTPNDPVTFAAVPVVFMLVALAACAIPALKALRVDPMRALRWE